ncbi:tetratricopeptide repeat protein [Synechococcus sp. CC9311]|uniref:tetratricopeptide repeat protein n=1 Tax=Synechococcus sp. (strain CC9311) TaxID=64471 RepID=UPI0000DDB26D|nr:tetratricopeptide repeat protein [Synechococcus sp. CC9311]ABI46723.1 O-linked GlcNAc transferase, putative [Synechococcus sp. CC9311]
MKKKRTLIAALSISLILLSPLATKSAVRNQRSKSLPTNLKSDQSPKSINGLIAQSKKSKDLEEGISLFNAGKYTDAISSFSRVITTDSPRKVKNKALLGRAQAYLVVKQPALAISDLKKIEYTPDEKEEQSKKDLVLGVCFIQLKSYDLAIKWLTDSITLVPNQASAYSNRAVAYQSKGNLQAAFKDLQLSLKLNPTPSTIYNLAVLEKKKENYQSCYELLSNLEKSEQTYPGIFLQKGLCASKLNKRDQALKDLIKAASLDKNNAFTLESIGSILAEAGKTKAAISYLEKAEQLYLINGKTEEYAKVSNMIANLNNQ